ncbi:hypothetical protein B0H14DRAFT_2568093 [Mycena olivaceomarginata]|nr:hypothetical protein B0H14DRAFT_2568093 [Mycena olivaceomarginata]
MGDLIALAGVVHGDIKADWTALKMEKKRELMLEGLYRGACAAPRNNTTELFLFAHPFVDHELWHTDSVPDELEAQMYIAGLLHNFYILETLFSILQAFLGLTPRNITPSNQHEVRCFRE